jgi:S-adenosylmethionine:diacylglycerol 3-amino-3-carboxypropyl transferase
MFIELAFGRKPAIVEMIFDATIVVVIIFESPTQIGIVEINTKSTGVLTLELRKIATRSRRRGNSKVKLVMLAFEAQAFESTFYEIVMSDRNESKIRVVLEELAEHGIARINVIDHFFVEVLEIHASSFLFDKSILSQSDEIVNK